MSFTQPTGFVATPPAPRTNVRALALTGLIAGYVLTGFSLVFFAVWLTMMISFVGLGLSAGS